MDVRRRTLMLGVLATPLAPLAAMAQPAKLFPGSRLAENDRFSVEVVGRGPDLVFIPGMVSSRKVWQATAERLKSHYRLHLIQVAGFAGEAPRANASGPVLEPTAEAIDTYLTQAHATPATLVGHSMGGTMALYLAQKHPDHYRKVMLVDAAPHLAPIMGIPPVAEQQMRSALAANTVRPASLAQMDAQFRTMASKLADQEMISRDSMASTEAVAGRAYVENLVLDLRPGLAAMRTPVTVIYPDNLPTGAKLGATKANYDAAFADLDRKTLIEVAASRHFVMLDQPEGFARELDTFLASKPR